MKTGESKKCKWITFLCTKDTGKTQVFEVQSNDSGFPIGTVGWYPSWRKYCFFPAANCVFETKCLQDIIEFINLEMVERSYKLKL